ncbi:MAG: PIN domain-containing protein [Planctomycetota bacterium]
MTLLDAIPTETLVGVDTAPIIYLIEQHSLFGPLVYPFFSERVDTGVNPIVTSIISLAEVLTKPIAMGRTDLADAYRDLLTKGPHLVILDLSKGTAERAAALRAAYGLRLPDAFQVAAAVDAGATHFLTNDSRLKVVRELIVVVLQDHLGSASR